MRPPGVRFTVRQMRAVLPLAALLTVVGCLVGRLWSPKPTSETGAIRLAEEFIARNGYTDLPVPGGTKLTPEPIEFASSREERLKFRHDTLEQKAVGASAMEGG